MKNFFKKILKEITGFVNYINEQIERENPYEGKIRYKNTYEDKIRYKK